MGVTALGFYLRWHICVDVPFICSAQSVMNDDGSFQRKTSHVYDDRFLPTVYLIIIYRRWTGVGSFVTIAWLWHVTFQNKRKQTVALSTIKEVNLLGTSAVLTVTVP